jgi:hypothetical protein
MLHFFSLLGMPTFSNKGTSNKRRQGANTTTASRTKRKKCVARILQNVEAQAEVVGPYYFEGTDDGTWQNDYVALFHYDSPHESLANIVQGNTILESVWAVPQPVHCIKLCTATKHSVLML